MATTFQRIAPEALAAYLSTDLNSLADSTSDTTGFSVVGADCHGRAIYLAGPWVL